MQRLSGQDSSFLALETPSTPMHIGWAAILDPEGRRRPTGDDLADLIADRIHLMPAFRRRLAQRRLGMVQPDWVDVDVDPRDHIVVHPDTDLLELCGVVLSTPLDRSRPLWELHMAPYLPDGRIALIVTMHHAIVDGPSGAELMVALLDLDPTVARLSPGSVPAADPGPGAARRWRTAARRLARGSRRAPGDLRAAARVGRSLRSWDDAHPGQRPPDPFTAPGSAINGRVTARRAVGFTSVSLAEVHRLREAGGATVNDVALAVVGGALRRWSQRRGWLPHRSLVAMVPVSVRGDDDNTAGNHTSALLTTLATDCADPEQRLARVAQVTGAAKRRHDDAGVGDLIRLADLVPPRTSAWFARFGGSWPPRRNGPLPFNVVVSNVPGPDVPFYCCGALMDEAYPMGPLTAWTGLNVTVLSYRDRLSFGLVTCPDVVDDVTDLLDAIDDEFADLSRATTSHRPPRRALTRPAHVEPEGCVGPWSESAGVGDGLARASSALLHWRNGLSWSVVEPPGSCSRAALSPDFLTP